MHGSLPQIVDYDPALNDHSSAADAAAFAAIFGDRLPSSLLDVGCGPGTWLRAALRAGVRDVLGLDGVVIPPDQMHVPARYVRHANLVAPIDLGRRFEWALCLEVAEHLEEAAAPVLIDTLTRHADNILFSAAIPHQPGQHHVNCQWPAYWQALFNRRGYACYDTVRWVIWSASGIKPWYRQNMFLARRDPAAGAEPRIPAVIHPLFAACLGAASAREATLADIRNGSQGLGWYLKLMVAAYGAKLKRRIDCFRHYRNTTMTAGSQ